MTNYLLLFIIIPKDL